MPRDNSTQILVNVLFKLIDAQEKTERAIVREAELATSTLSKWKAQDYTPGIQSFNKALHVLGFRLTIERIPNGG